MGRIVTGARALVVFNSNVVGLFSDVTYRVGIDVQPAYVLGKYGPGELDYTGHDPISIQATGWRVMGRGPHASNPGDDDGKDNTPLVPKLTDLLNADYIATIEVFDRQSGLPVIKIENLKSLGYTGGQSVRQLSQCVFNYFGLVASDESDNTTPDGGLKEKLPKVFDSSSL